MKKRLIVVGIGNPNFKDDGVGFKIVEILKNFENLKEKIEITWFLNVDFKIIDAILHYDVAILVDAVKTGKPPGTIIEFNFTETFKNVYPSGTHNKNLFEVIELGYKVFEKEMPKIIKIIGIEVEDMDTIDKNLTPEVEKAIPEAVQKISNYIENYLN